MYATLVAPNSPSCPSLYFFCRRYHTDDQIQLGNKVPGRISKNLRRALGLGRFQLPLHVYKMRTYGYPPGWLLHAKVSHSGLELFDSQVNFMSTC